MRLVRSFTLAASAWIALAAAPAAAATLLAEYDISLAGLPIGKADLAATIEGDRYQLQLQARLTGLAGIVTDGKGGATAAGILTAGRPLPAAFAVTARSARDQRTVRIGLLSGNVAAVDIAPPLGEQPDRVPLNEAHKRGVLDPLSAILATAPARGDLADPGNCNRTLPVFDGAARFDIILSYAETKQVQMPGYAGPILVCDIRYRPIAGHRPGRPAIKFMEENRDMFIWLAPVERLRVLMPVRISVRTMIGTSLVEASRWTLDQSAASARPSSGRAR